MTISLVAKKKWLTKFTVGGVAIWLAFYSVMLFGYSVTSGEKLLVESEPKEYCGFYLDCHLHTMVTGVRTASKIGGENANGTFYIVNVKVFSDAKNPTIAFRLLHPEAEIIDSSGQKFQQNFGVEKYLPTGAVRLGDEIKGGQTIEKEIVFDLPNDAADAKLLITEGYGIDKVIESVLIGDEDSIFHARTFFKVQEQTAKASVK